MTLATRPAVVGGICDSCHQPYEPDDFVAQVGDDILCPDCIVDHLMLETN